MISATIAIIIGSIPLILKIIGCSRLFQNILFADNIMKNRQFYKAIYNDPVPVTVMP